MTQEEKRIKIAEACGWHEEKEPVGSFNASAWWHHETRYPSNTMPVPDYFNNLNDCHEMERVLKDQEIEQYNDLLGSFLWSGYPASRRNFHATAAQRAEAFGRVKGLWE